MTSCVLEETSGSRVEGERAWELLRTVTPWLVTLAAVEPDGFQVDQGVSALDLIPVRQVPFVPTDLLQSLPTKERLIVGMVFVLIDGQREVRHVKASLHLSASAIDHALATLWQWHAIDYRHEHLFML